ncbi:MAG: ABC transporter permease [Comamonadaceae bacterium]|nr:ABC transporter permease [Comamonadaceae bacterium]
MPETVHTALVVAGAHLARLCELVPSGGAASLAFFLALAFAGATWWLLFRATTGYELRAVGLSPVAAEYGGVSRVWATLVVMALGGALAGLFGTSFVLGYKLYFEEGMAAGTCFMGIAVALLGRGHPVGVVLAALLLGTLSQGGLVVNALVPKELVGVLQAVIIPAVAASSAAVARGAGRAGGEWLPREPGAVRLLGAGAAHQRALRPGCAGRRDIRAFRRDRPGARGQAAGRRVRHGLVADLSQSPGSAPAGAAAGARW